MVGLGGLEVDSCVDLLYHFADQPGMVRASPEAEWEALCAATGGAVAYEAPASPEEAPKEAQAGAQDDGRRLRMQAAVVEYDKPALLAFVEAVGRQPLPVALCGHMLRRDR